MQPIGTDLASLVCVTVCLLVVTISYDRTAEPVNMQFGMWTQVGPRSHVRRGSGSPKLFNAILTGAPSPT